MGAVWQTMGSCPSSEVLRGENPKARAQRLSHHFAPTLGKHPFPISGRGTPTSDLRGPEGPRAEREKLTRASPSRAREVTHSNGPASSLLRPHSLRRKKPLTKCCGSQRAAAEAAAAAATSPGVAGHWRAASPHHAATLDLRRRRVKGSPHPAREARGPTFPVAFAALAHGPPGTVVSFQSRLQHGGSTYPPSWKVEARRGGAAGPDPVGVGRIPSRPVAPGWDRGPSQRALS